MQMFIRCIVRVAAEPEQTPGTLAGIRSGWDTSPLLGIKHAFTHLFIPRSHIEQPAHLLACFLGSEGKEQTNYDGLLITKSH